MQVACFAISSSTYCIDAEFLWWFGFSGQALSITRKYIYLWQWKVGYTWSTQYAKFPDYFAKCSVTVQQIFHLFSETKTKHDSEFPVVS